MDTISAMMRPRGGDSTTFEYVRHLRSQGYPGTIQLVSLTLARESGSESTPFDFSRKLAPQLEELATGAGMRNERLILAEIDTHNDPVDHLEYLDLIWRAGEDQPALPAEPAISAPRGSGIPYWQPIREHINNDMIFSAGITLLIRDEQENIVILRRRDDGEWSLPAGSREIGESLELAALHEAREETGLSIRIDRLCAIQSGPEMEWVYPNGHRSHFLSFLYEAHAEGGTLHVADDENTDARWARIDEARRILRPRWNRQVGFLLSPPGRIALV